MVGVEQHGDVHHAGLRRVRPLTCDHPEEVLGVAQLRVRPQDPLPFPDPLVRGHDRRELRGDPERLPHVRGLRGIVPLRIEAAHVRDGGPEDVHRRRVLRHRSKQLQDGRRKGSCGGEFGPRAFQLRAIRQAALEQEEDDLLEGGMPGQVSDVVPAVQESSAFPVDEADRRLLHVDVVEASMDLRGVQGRFHTSPPDRLNIIHRRGLADTKVERFLNVMVTALITGRQTGMRTIASAIAPKSNKAR